MDRIRIEITQHINNWLGLANCLLGKVIGNRTFFTKVHVAAFRMISLSKTLENGLKIETASIPLTTGSITALHRNPPA